MKYLIISIILALVIYGFVKVYQRGIRVHHIIATNPDGLDKSELKEVIQWNFVRHFFGAMGVAFVGLFIWGGYVDLTTPDEVRKQNVKNYRENKEKELEKYQLNMECEKFEAARQQCAAAANYSQCIEIKGTRTVYIDICPNRSK